MIAGFEALYLYAYPDPGTGNEPWTIGIGATKYDGQGPVRKGDRITVDRAIARFRETIRKKYTPEVLKAIKIELTQPRLNSAVSLHYNTGAISSGSIDDKLNRGDEAAALATWAAYNKAGGKVLAGLVTRRAEEIALWRTGVYPKRAILVRDANGSKRTIAPENFPWDVDVPKLEVNVTIPTLAPPPLPEPRPSFNFIVDLFNAILRFFNVR
jgi:lysozyme